MCSLPYFRWYGINKIEYAGGNVRMNWVDPEVSRWLKANKKGDGENEKSRT